MTGNKKSFFLPHFPSMETSKKSRIFRFWNFFLPKQCKSFPCFDCSFSGKKNHYFGIHNQKWCFFFSEKNPIIKWFKLKKKNVFRTLFLVESCFRICANECWHRFPKCERWRMKIKKKNSIFDANPGKWAYSAYFFWPFGLKKLLKYLYEIKTTCEVSCHFEIFSVKIGQKLTSLRKNEKGGSFWRCTVAHSKGFSSLFSFF